MCCHDYMFCVNEPHAIVSFEIATEALFEYVSICSTHVLYKFDPFFIHFVF